MLVKPTAASIRRYGQTDADWEMVADRQGRVCGVCGNLPRSGRLHTDHEHVPGWKKLPPELRKLFVRGQACFLCNTRVIGRGVTLAILQGAVKYLEAYENRKTLAMLACQHAGAAAPSLCCCSSDCFCRSTTCKIKKARKKGRKNAR